MTDSHTRYATPLTEQRVREIVREEMARAIAEAELANVAAQFGEPYERIADEFDKLSARLSAAAGKVTASFVDAMALPYGELPQIDSARSPQAPERPQPSHPLGGSK